MNLKMMLMQIINFFLLLCLPPLQVASQIGGSCTCGPHEAYNNCSAPSACCSSHSYGRCGVDPCLLHVSYGKCIISDHCCSAFGYCGTTDAHCDVHCQKAFGRCPSLDDGPVSKPSCSTLGWTSNVIAMLAVAIALIVLCFQGLPHTLAELVDYISRYKHPYH